MYWFCSWRTIFIWAGPTQTIQAFLQSWVCFFTETDTQILCVLGRNPQILGDAKKYSMLLWHTAFKSIPSNQFKCITPADPLGCRYIHIKQRKHKPQRQGLQVYKTKKAGNQSPLGQHLPLQSAVLILWINAFPSSRFQGSEKYKRATLSFAIRKDKLSACTLLAHVLLCCEAGCPAFPSL